MYRGEVKVNFGKPELEGYWYAGSDEGQKPEVACILSHPHPKLGGDMRNNVVAALAFSLQNTGRYMTLRFNTRGVGRSKGSSTWTGKSERNDFIAAVSFVRGQENVKKIYFVGYSFGSAVGLSANKAYGEVVDGYIAISYPKGFFSSFLFSSHYKLADSNKDKLFIHGDNGVFVCFVYVSNELYR